MPACVNADWSLISQGRPQRFLVKTALITPKQKNQAKAIMRSGVASPAM